jgi:LysM repeat protein
MTNLQEDLTLALQRRAEAVSVENHLDAILDDSKIIRFSSPNGADPRRSRGLLVAVSVAVLVGASGLIWATDSRTQPPAASSSDPAPLGTGPEADSVSTPDITPETIPAEFPSDVPRPDTYDLMTIMTNDNEPVGWEFYDQREPTDSVERCTEFASSFDASWTSTPKVDEDESVLYAQVFDNGQWQVGIYCINDGAYLVQVMPTGAILPSSEPTPTTMVMNPSPLIEPGTVVCVDAGASPRAIGLCVDELGGEVIEASTANEDSFVVAVDGNNPAHVVAAQNVANVLGLPLRTPSPELIPTATTLGDEVTSYLVIGSSDVPYASPSNAGQGTPTTLSGVTGGGVTGLEQSYTVVAGDTLVSIAGRYGFPPAQLDVFVDLNGWDGSDVNLTPGDIVRIPPGGIIPRNE